MAIYRIKDWTTHSPHWGAAFIEADSPEDAVEIMKAEIVKDIEGVWPDSLMPLEGWTAVEVTHPFVFILGSGCRS